MSRVDCCLRFATVPSPLMGEGYGDLAPQGPSRSWKGVARSHCRRSITPIQASLARCASKLRYPSPIEGEGRLAHQRKKWGQALFRAAPRAKRGTVPIFPACGELRREKEGLSLFSRFTPIQARRLLRELVTPSFPIKGESCQFFRYINALEITRPGPAAAIRGREGRRSARPGRRFRSGGVRLRLRGGRC